MLCLSLLRRNPSAAQLYRDELVESPDSHLTEHACLSVYSGAYTGRFPDAKRIVKSEFSESDIWWCRPSESNKSTPNIPLSRETFKINLEIACEFLNNQEQIYVIDGWAGWHNDYRLAIRVYCSRAYHALFMQNMLINPTEQELETWKPDFEIFNAGQCECTLEPDNHESGVSVAFDLGRRQAVILGTQYAGEMKKGIFTLFHYFAPIQWGILSLHSAVNVDQQGDNPTLFFGLSGTGKTTLSADSSRRLIGDDEHCWCDDGLFNIEGGCYAKCIGLSSQREPEIFNALKFGSVLENVVTHRDKVDFNDAAITQNTRACYPIEFVDNAWIPCQCSHPKNIIFLTCDAFGILPAVSKLSFEQAIYYFISGYTAKIAGTEIGILDPEATFSACFGQAFLPCKPELYGKLLEEKLLKYKTNVWLVNTGWLGNAYGMLGSQRCPLKYTRKIIDAIHDGSLEIDSKLEGFNLEYARQCPGCNGFDLSPIWRDRQAYVAATQRLAGLFRENFKSYAKESEWLASFTKHGPE